MIFGVGQQGRQKASQRYNQVETYSRIVLLRSHGNLQSYWTTTKLKKNIVPQFESDADDDRSGFSKNFDSAAATQSRTASDG